MLGRVAFAALTAAAAGLPSGPSLKERVLGVTVGPVSRSQPDAQPVAAGPVKVGLKVPRLAEVTLAALAVPAVAVACAGAACAPPETAISPTGRVSSAPAIRNLKRTFCLNSRIKRLAFPGLVNRYGSPLLRARGPPAHRGDSRGYDMTLQSCAVAGNPSITDV